MKTATATTKTEKEIAAFVAAARATRSESGVARLTSKEIAKLIRLQLKRNFPTVKFSVRSDYNSVNVYWDNGPTANAVDAVIGQYKFGGFDGMIDLAYSYDNWLLPDGTMQVANDGGTTGSRGSHSPRFTDCPVPGAFIVDAPTDYVFSHRTISDDRYELLALEAQTRYGIEVDFSAPMWSQNFRGENLASLARRVERDIESGSYTPMNEVSFA